MIGNKQLYRDTENGVLSGVSAGLAAYFDVDVVWVRLAWVLLMFSPVPFVLITYIVMWIVMPTSTAANGDGATTSTIDGKPVATVHKTGKTMSVFLLVMLALFVGLPLLVLFLLGAFLWLIFELPFSLFAGIVLMVLAPLVGFIALILHLLSFTKEEKKSTNKYWFSYILAFLMLLGGISLVNSGISSDKLSNAFSSFQCHHGSIDDDCDVVDDDAPLATDSIPVEVTDSTSSL